MKNYLTYNKEVSLRFRDMDSYGIIHHSNYFSYFEEARCNFAKECLNLTNDMLSGKSIKFPVIQASCEYRNAITYAMNTINIELKFRLLENCKIEFLYTITDNRGKVCAKGMTIHALVIDDKLCLAYPEWLEERVAQLIKKERE